MSIDLEIYIETDCVNCDTAYEIAALVQDKVPGVRVTIIDLSKPGSAPPQEVFAVPTYLINGQVRSLGNPDGEELVEDLKAILNQSEVS